MIYPIYLIVLVLFLSACDLKQPPEEVDLDTVYDNIPSYTNETNYPYIEKFKNVLESSQYESSNENKFILDDNFYDLYYAEDFNREEFYLDTSRNLVFTLDKKKNSPRVASQLIQNDTWTTSEDNGNYLISLVRSYKPKETNSYTWMQVHGVNKADSNSSIYYNYPLLRLTWERNMKNQYDHIWAVLTKSSPGVDEPKIYEWIDLGSRPDNFFAAEIHIAHNIMEIKINHSTLSIQNVSYWENVPSFFKVGIFIESYLDGGKAGVSFNELRFENNASNVENITHF